VVADIAAIPKNKVITSGTIIAVLMLDFFICTTVPFLCLFRAFGKTETTY
jgi:hypothetical protein